LGADRPLERLSGWELERAAREAWGTLAPATWNRHVATLRSFSSFCCRRGWLDEAVADGLERRREPVDRTKAIPYALLERLWRRDDVAVREKALWRLLYETAARAQEVLSLNVEASTWTTSARGCAPRAATPSGCTCRPARRGCSPG
jgi:integrase